MAEKSRAQRICVWTAPGAKTDSFVFKDISAHLNVITPVSKTQKVILLAEMQIWKYPISRIQNFFNCCNLIGQNKPTLDVSDLRLDTPTSQLASSSRLFGAQPMVASLLRIYGCTTVKCNISQ
jgi:hypothetical protein